MTEYCQNASQNFWAEKQLSDADILFGNERVPNEELEACWTYELARESQTLRSILKNGWHRVQSHLLPEDAPRFLGRETTLGDLTAFLYEPARLSAERRLQLRAQSEWAMFEKWMPLLEWNAREDWSRQMWEERRRERRQKLEPAWNDLSAGERRRFEESNRAAEWSAGRLEIPSADPYFLTKGYQELPEGRISRSPTSFCRGIHKVPFSSWEFMQGPGGGHPHFRTPSHGGSDCTITSYDGEWVCLFIGWRGKTDDELSEMFKEWAKENRPKEFLESARRELSRGWSIDELQTRQRLRKLGACRLFAKYRNRTHLKDEWKNVWGKNITRMRKDCQTLAHLFHERFPFLSPDEKPACLTLCEEKGRFAVKAKGGLG